MEQASGTVQEEQGKQHKRLLASNQLLLGSGQSAIILYYCASNFGVIIITSARVRGLKPAPKAFN